MDEIHPKLFFKIYRSKEKNRIEKIKLSELRETTRERYISAKFINSSYLKSSQKQKTRGLHSKFINLTNKEKKRQKEMSLREYKTTKNKEKAKERLNKLRTFSGMMSSKTGIPIGDIKISQEVSKKVGTLAERVIAATINLSNITDKHLNYPFSGKTPFFGVTPKIALEQNGKNPASDIRAGDYSIEVKSGNNFSDEEIRKAIDKYSPGKKWKDGVPIKGNYIVLMQDSSSMRQRAKQLEAHNINVIFGKEFLEHLKKITLRHEKELNLGSMYPRIHSPDTIIQFLSKFKESPARIFRDSNKLENHYFMEVMYNLASLKPNNNSLEEKLFFNEGLEMQGANGGNFLICNPDIQDHPLAKNLERNLNYLFEDIRLPDFEGRTNFENLISFDLETAGFGTSQILTLALSHIKEKDKKLNTQVLVARDPSEEKPLLEYFLQTINSFKGNPNSEFVTHNGKTFDFSKYTKRAWHNGISIDGTKTMRDVIKNQHIDTYPLSKKTLPNLPNYKLKTIEKEVFEVIRDEDIEGKQIPRAYHSYLFGRMPDIERRNGEFRTGNSVLEEKAIKEMSKIVMHNAIDVITPLAILAHLKSN